LGFEVVEDEGVGVVEEVAGVVTAAVRLVTRRWRCTRVAYVSLAV